MPHLDVDSLLDFEEVNDEAIEEVLSLAPFGYGNPSPVFAVRDAEAASDATFPRRSICACRCGRMGDRCE